MIKQLGSSEGSFDFLVQVQGPGMPIEDPTIRWDERKSPFQKVATICIPAQNFDTPVRRELSENLSFNPWHTLPDHRPLGGINRVRKQVYQSISELRHQLNDVPVSEPDVESI
ncbi:MAG: hypothetical protein M3Y56_16405 [Armatimonadota bacterium]|nr:hypothetical protein [Armatimonadota bacterium]